MNWLYQLASLVEPGPLPQATANSDTAKLIIQIVFGIIGAMTVVILTFAGFKYVISKGNPENTAKAKNMIIYSVIGLVVSLMAFSIVTFVVGRL